MPWSKKNSWKNAQKALRVRKSLKSIEELSQRLKRCKECDITKKVRNNFRIVDRSSGRTSKTCIMCEVAAGVIIFNTFKKSFMYNRILAKKQLS